MKPNTLFASISRLVEGKFQSIKQADWTPAIIKGADSFSVFSTDLTPEGLAEQTAYFNEMAENFSWPKVCPHTGVSLVKVTEIPAVDFDGNPVLDSNNRPTMKRVMSCSAISHGNSADVLRALMAKA